MTSRDTAKRRIEKLINLAEGSTSEAESESAMRIARSLMIKHAISEAEARDGRVKEEIVRRQFKAEQRFAWHRTIANAVAGYCNCRMYYNSWRGVMSITMVGYSSDTEIAEYLYKSVARQVMAMSKAHARRMRRYGGRVDHVGFGNAAAHKVWDRLLAMQDTVDAEEQVSESTALVLRSRKKEVDEFFGTIALRTSTYSSDNWSEAGSKAGGRVNLSKGIQGGSRGELT